jgi:GNAT superfamily N-acetyltransferase
MVTDLYRAEDASENLILHLGDRFVPERRFYIVVSDEHSNIHGFASFTTTLYQGLWLLEMEVVPEHRRSGVGLELARYLVEFARPRTREIRFEATNDSGTFWRSVATRLGVELQQERRSERFGAVTTCAGRMRFLDPSGCQLAL